MDIRTAAELGVLIRTQRKQRGLSQQALADRAGVGRQWLVDVEKGKPRAEVGLILRTLDALELALSVRQPRQPSQPSRTHPHIDLDALIEQHRGR